MMKCGNVRYQRGRQNGGTSECRMEAHQRAAQHLQHLGGLDKGKVDREGSEKRPGEIVKMGLLPKAAVLC